MNEFGEVFIFVFYFLFAIYVTRVNVVYPKIYDHRRRKIGIKSRIPINEVKHHTDISLHTTTITTTTKTRRGGRL